LRLRALIAALFVRAARLVVMGERGSGRALQADLDRCGAAAYRHLGLQQVFEVAALGPAIDLETDRRLQDFFTGPRLPLVLLVERLAPELGPGSRAEIADSLEELIRDLAEQFGTGGPLLSLE
jgi:hypothetical protein